MLAFLRQCFATNSSSTHSIIMLDDKDKHKGSKADGDYGWDRFLLTAAEGKMQYFHIACIEHYRELHKLSHDCAKVLAEKYFPINDPDFYGYIDHQSMPAFPIPLYTGDYSDECTKQSDLWTWIRTNIINNNRVAIAGGNDNGEVFMEDSVRVPVLWETDNYEGYQVFKKDPTGFITAFNRANGTLRRSLDAEGKVPASGMYPDLVDLKITDMCSKECPHCYQGSTKTGKHGEIKIINSLVYVLQSMGVFEVAIGGGEPTEHPDFANILRWFDSVDIVPSFSTQNMEWLKNRELYTAVSRYCGAVAFSTTNIKEALYWKKQANKREVPNPTIHYVLGLEPLDSFKKFMPKMASVYMPVVLLKWKNTGRAVTQQPYDTTGWWDIVRDTKGTVSIDSFLIDDVKKNMPEIPEYLYSKDDGKFSFYVDAVTQQIAAHSATPTEARHSFKCTSEVADLFQVIRSQNV